MLLTISAILQEPKLYLCKAAGVDKEDEAISREEALPPTKKQLADISIHVNHRNILSIRQHFI